jgi:hypothetical protein
MAIEPFDIVRLSNHLLHQNNAGKPEEPSGMRLVHRLG